MRLLALLSLLLFSFQSAFAEGTKQLSPTANDTTALIVNNITYGSFARVGAAVTSRLSFRLGSPGQEQVYFGFSSGFRGVDSLDRAAARTTYYYRVMTPSGAVAQDWQVINNTTANLNTHAQVVAGPSALGAPGGYAAFTYVPVSGAIAGDYYIEISQLNTGANGIVINIPRFDITVATRATTPVELPGRVFAKDWALSSPPALATVDPIYGNFDRPFNGQFFVYSPQGFVSRINFQNAGFRPNSFNISFNSTGTVNFLDPLNNLRSVDNQKRTNPEFQIFLQQPSEDLYPSGSFGTMITNADYPKLYGCNTDNKYYIDVAVTKEGQVEVLIDQNGNDGKFTPNTADRMLSLDIAPRLGETAPYKRQVPWDGRDGLGNIVANQVNLNTRVTFSQVPYHLPVFDAEYLVNGFNVTMVRPTPPAGYTFTYQWDDRNILENAPAGKEKVELEGCSTGCHTWDNYDYGNDNTINTYWFARREAIVSLLNRTDPACGCSAAGTLTIGGKVFKDSDGSLTRNTGETGYTGVDAYLYGDTNANGIIDGGETISQTNITNALGEFSFTVNTTGTPGSANVATTTAAADAVDLGPLFSAASRYNTGRLVFGGFTTGTPAVNYPVTASVFFTGLTIPKNATITSAILRVVGATSPLGAPNANGVSEARIYAESGTNPAITSSTSYPVARSRTATNTYWKFSTAVVNNTSYDSPSLVDVIQEVVKTPAYATNDNIHLLVQGTGAYNSFQQSGTGIAPRLIISYTLYNLPQTYVVSVDQSDVPTGTILTGDASRAVGLYTPSDYSCFNDFGFGEDRDKDGVVDGADLDNDNDGVPDSQEAGTTGFSPTADADGDGILNFEDNMDTTPGFIAWVDVNMDGVHDRYDADGDGVPDAYDLDSDNDGITDLTEAGGIDATGNGTVDSTADADGDGLADAYDNNDTDGPLGNGLDTTTPSTSSLIDRNADGIADGADADGDSVPNYRDLDSDNDGMTDAYEAGKPDTNGDGRLDVITDTDGDGLANSIDPAHEGPASGSTTAPTAGTPTILVDHDRDGIADGLDLDSDGDGIADVVEAGGTDANGNGRLDNATDTDGDGLADAIDGDANNDGTAENTANRLISPDTDQDGIRDILDRDSDNDGIADAVEAGAVDINGDGVADATADTDGDGLANVYDAAHDGPQASITTAPTVGAALASTGTDSNNDGRPDTACSNCDLDRDGRADWLDIDADNDGVADVAESGGTDANGDGRADNFSDADGDGLNDRLDGDANNDGVAENTSQALLATGADTNGDGRPDSYPNHDTDRDGRIDSQDLDSDNDGIADVTEAGGTDTNGDGQLDTFVDADSDGFNDMVDADPTNVLAVGTDSAGANTANALVLTSADANADARPETYVKTQDTDADGIANRLDLDSDNDGITDVVEAGGIDTQGDGRLDDTIDTDGDGFADSVDADPSNALAAGSAATGTNDAGVLVRTGADTNNDGKPNSNNGCDIDGDGIFDFLDLDSDNDGIADLVEAMGADADGNGRVDNTADLDGDGLADVVDGDDDTSLAANDGTGALVKTDASGLIVDTRSFQFADFDGDGFPNWADRDSDNDGITDLIEAKRNVAIDTNQDGRIDVAAGWDANGDGLADSATPVLTASDANGNGSVLEEGFGASTPDTDGDGTVDYRDLDSDGDGLTDVVEQNSGSTSNDLATGSLDGMMPGSSTDYTVNRQASALDTDGDGVADYLDIDADNDGLLDSREAVCSTCPRAAGSTTTDVNRNGIDDGFESLTAANATGGTNAGSTPVDQANTDLDTTPDYLDQDTDGDMAFDWTEGFDDDGNGIALNDLIARAASFQSATAGAGPYTTADADSDGVPDWLDNLSGPGVTESGRPPFLTPGSAFYRDANSNGLVDLFDALMTGGQSSLAPNRDGMNDRDWRDNVTAAPLPVELMSFSAKQAEDCGKISASWRVGTENNVSHYTLETSPDGRSFSKAVDVAAIGRTDYQQLLASAGAVTYVRLSSTDRDGGRADTQVVAVYSNCATGKLNVTPNPLPAGTELNFTSAVTEVLVLIDPLGRVVRRIQAEAGVRSQLPTEGLPSSLYTLSGAQQAAVKVMIQ